MKKLIKGKNAPNSEKKEAVVSKGKAIRKKKEKGHKINLYHKVLKNVNAKIITAFALNILLALVVIIMLISNSMTLQNDYNQMLDKLFIANDASLKVTSFVGKIQQAIDTRDYEVLEEAETEFAIFDSHMQFLMSFEDPENMKMPAQRRKLLYDDIVKNYNAYFEARETKDVALQTKAHENLKDMRDLIKVQLESYIINEAIGEISGVQTELQKTFTSALIKVVIVFVVGFVVTLAMVIFVSSYISGGLKRLSKGAEEIGNGNLSAQIPRINSRDELNKLATAFGIMQDNLKHIVEDQISMSKQISTATGDLLTNVDEANSASVEIADSVAGMIEKMSDQKAKMKSIQEQIGDITSKTGEIQHISTKAKNEAIKSLEAVDLGEKMIETFVVKMKDIKTTTTSTREAVDNLVEVASAMNGILESMNGISDQTTLLSLNASIEAARAGTEGRSFGVVAQEIRKLAENSGALGEDIGKMIKSTQGLLGNVHDFIGSVQDKIDESEGINKEVTKSFENIKIINKEVDVNNKSIDQRVDDLSSLCKNIETASNETYELVQDNQAFSESISAAVQEEVATFEEIKDYVEKLDAMADTSSEQMGKFKL